MKSLAVVILLTVATIDSQAESDGLLVRLCNSDERVELSSFSQLLQLKADLEQEQYSNCPGKIRSAILELVGLIKHIEDDQCSLDKVQQTRSFQGKHLNFDGQPIELVPGPLRRFLLAFGLRVANECKAKVLNFLANEANDVLSDQDHQLIREWSGKSLIDKIIKGSNGRFDLLLPSDYARNEATTNLDEKIYIQIESSHKLREPQLACKRRLRPIYEQSLLPAIELNKLGFDYQSDRTEIRLKDEYTRASLSRWERIVFICESLKLYKFVELSNCRNRKQDALEQ